MNQRLSRLAERRERLIDEIARQRTLLSNDVEPWRNALAKADQGMAALRYVREHPLWVVGVSSVLLALAGPSRVWRWFGAGAIAWRMISQLRIR